MTAFGRPIDRGARALPLGAWQGMWDARRNGHTVTRSSEPKPARSRAVDERMMKLTDDAPAAGATAYGAPCHEADTAAGHTR